LGEAELFQIKDADEPLPVHRLLGIGDRHRAVGARGVESCGAVGNRNAIQLARSHGHQVSIEAKSRRGTDTCVAPAASHGEVFRLMERGLNAEQIASERDTGLAYVKAVCRSLQHLLDGTMPTS
jgi:hypothetical protein